MPAETAKGVREGWQGARMLRGAHGRYLIYSKIIEFMRRPDPSSSRETSTALRAKQNRIIPQSSVYVVHIELRHVWVSDLLTVAGIYNEHIKTSICLLNFRYLWSFNESQL